MISTSEGGHHSNYFLIGFGIASKNGILNIQMLNGHLKTNTGFPPLARYSDRLLLALHTGLFPKVMRPFNKLIPVIHDWQPCSSSDVFRFFVNK